MVSGSRSADSLSSDKARANRLFTVPGAMPRASAVCSTDQSKKMRQTITARRSIDKASSARSRVSSRSGVRPIPPPQRSNEPGGLPRVCVAASTTTTSSARRGRPRRRDCRSGRSSTTAGRPGSWPRSRRLPPARHHRASPQVHRQEKRHARDRTPRTTKHPQPFAATARVRRWQPIEVPRCPSRSTRPALSFGSQLHSTCAAQRRPVRAHPSAETVPPWSYAWVMPRGNPSPKLAITVDPDVHEGVVAPPPMTVSACRPG